MPLQWLRYRHILRNLIHHLHPSSVNIEAVYQENRILPGAGSKEKPKFFWGGEG